jgi:hypothetical protein
MKTNDSDVTLSNGTLLDPYLACAYAEGFCEGENASFHDQVKAWAFLIRTGQCWTLQGWFGRSAQSIIEGGSISSEGVINWDVIAEAEESN